MEQHKNIAYLKLIQKLLTCPQGEEWIHLKREEHLVDAQFVQVMEQVAFQLARQGDREAATFLHNWAAKLHHILVKETQPRSPEKDKSEAYLDLIQQLLDCPEGKEDQILTDHQALVGPELVHKMREVGQQLRHRGRTETAEYLENLATQLNQEWLRVHNFQANFQKAPVNREPIPALATSHSSPESVSQAAASTPSPSVPTPPVPSPVPDSGDPWNSLPEDTDSPTATPLPSRTSMQPHRQAIADGLNAIAQALQQLNQTLAVPRSPHPLWYLEVLEHACAANWQLTTEEVEQLIGVKPQCHREETVYRRGSWCFTKVGKVGSQTAWRVTKARDEESTP